MAIQMDGPNGRFEVGSEFEAEMATLRGNRRVEQEAATPARPRSSEPRPTTRPAAQEPEGQETGRAGVPPTT